MNGTLATVATIGGITLQKSITKTGDHTSVHGNGVDEISLPAATELADYQNDEDDTATGTLTAGHGLSTGVYDLYWADGVRYGVGITITVNAADITASGAGDALPVDDTTVNISEQVQINAAIDGDAVALIVINASQRSHVECIDADDDTIAAIELLGDEPFTWHDTNGITNPFTGDPITVIEASNGVTSAASILAILLLEDSTP